MNRRHYLSVLGGLISGSAIGSNVLSEESMAIEYSLNPNQSLPYIEEPAIKMHFNSFKLITNNIDTNNAVKITLKSSINNENVKK